MQIKHCPVLIVWANLHPDFHIQYTCLRIFTCEPEIILKVSEVNETAVNSYKKSYLACMHRLPALIFFILFITFTCKPIMRCWKAVMSYSMQSAMETVNSIPKDYLSMRRRLGKLCSIYLYDTGTGGYTFWKLE